MCRLIFEINELRKKVDGFKFFRLTVTIKDASLSQNYADNSSGGMQHKRLVNTSFYNASILYKRLSEMILS